MPASIVLNKRITYESCPICQMPNCKIEHGYTEEYGKIDAAHYETCENCGTHIVLVCYDCPECLKE